MWKRNNHRSFWFVLEKNSGRRVTWLMWRHRFQKASFSKCFPSTRKRQAGVFKFLRFEERFRNAPVSWRISVDGRPNRRSKAAISDSSRVQCKAPKMIIPEMFFNTCDRMAAVGSPRSLLPRCTCVRALFFNNAPHIAWPPSSPSLWEGEKKMPIATESQLVLKSAFLKENPWLDS